MGVFWTDLSPFKSKLIYSLRKTTIAAGELPRRYFIFTLKSRCKPSIDNVMLQDYNIV